MADHGRLGRRVDLGNHNRLRRFGKGWRWHRFAVEPIRGGRALEFDN
ncbi:MAG TPA: hypothetical protein VHW68_05990 [Actinomycetota bacterium]|nr:hypothetical protein [Actinomycetota bacterium]